MIPASPQPGTADTNPLVTLAQYQVVTGDTATLQAAFAAQLIEALDIFQRETRRTLLYGQYIERLFLYPNGMVYPTATPINTSKPVQNPTGEPPGESLGVIQGNGIWVGWFVPLPSMPIWTGVVPPQTDISYWGGYTGATLPGDIVRILAKMVWYMLHPATLSGAPAGVTSVSVGGVSMAGRDLSSMVDRDRTLARQIKRWRHPHVKAFDGQVTT